MLQYREQVQELDCGVSVVQIMHKYFYDQWISLAALKSNVNYQNNGINILELSSLAEKFGMHLESYQGSADLLAGLELKSPVISMIQNHGFFHYIVIEKIKNDYVFYYDPINGRIKIKLNQFKEKYAGVIIACEKTSYQYTKENQMIKLFQFDFLKEAIWLALVSVIIVALAFLSTFYIKIVLDQIIPSQLKDQFLLITFFFIGLFIVKSLLGSTKKWFLHKIELKYNLNYINKYLDKINTIKWIKINQFDESMHLKNIELLSQITSFKANYLFTTISQGFCLIFATAILIWLDFTIFFITLVCSCLIVGITFLFQKKFKVLEKASLHNSILFRKAFLNILAGVDQYKISSIKYFLQRNLHEKMDESLDISIVNVNYDTTYDLIISFIKNIVPYIIAVLSVSKIWLNQLSVGQLLLFMSIFNFFIDPMSTFTAMLIEIPINQQYTDNLNAFFILEDENKNVDGYKIETIEEIKIEKLNFSFIEGKRVLRIPHLVLNENYHLIGKNGSGKSTLLKIIAALINVETVSYNGKLVDYYNLDHLRSQICYISNHEYMPSCTIYQYLTNNLQANIKVFLENVDRFALLDLFEMMNLQLADHLDDGGKNLSAGQKQFVSLMKIFASDYSLVLLDEAFENLDLNILNALLPVLQKRLAKTLVLEISHRKNYLFTDAKELDCEQFK